MTILEKMLDLSQSVHSLERGNEQLSASVAGTKLLQPNIRLF